MDRVEERARTDVETVRAGTIYAHDSKAYQKWRRHRLAGPALSRDALESAVMNVARMFPDNVTRGVM